MVGCLLAILRDNANSFPLGSEAVDGLMKVIVDGSMTGRLAIPMVETKASFAVDEYKSIRLDFNAFLDLLLTAFLDFGAQIVGERDDVTGLGIFPSILVLGI